MLIARARFLHPTPYILHKNSQHRKPLRDAQGHIRKRKSFISRPIFLFQNSPPIYPTLNIVIPLPFNLRFYLGGACAHCIREENHIRPQALQVSLCIL